MNIAATIRTVSPHIWIHVVQLDSGRYSVAVWDDHVGAYTRHGNAIHTTFTPALLEARDVAQGSDKRPGRRGMTTTDPIDALRAAHAAFKRAQDAADRAFTRWYRGETSSSAAASRLANHASEAWRVYYVASMDAYLDLPDGVDPFDVADIPKGDRCY